MNAHPQPRWLTAPVRHCGRMAAGFFLLLVALAVIAEFCTRSHSL